MLIIQGMILFSILILASTYLDSIVSQQNVVNYRIPPKNNIRRQKQYYVKNIYGRRSNISSSSHNPKRGPFKKKQLKKGPCKLNKSPSPLVNYTNYNNGLYELQQKAKMAYDKIIPCLQNSKYIDIKYTNCNPFSSLKLPDDAYQHYQFLLNATEKFRKIPIHSYLDYSGPWIENYYINYFINKPLEYFNGLIPLFIQFVDIHSFEFSNDLRNVTHTVRSVSDYLISILRDDCIYVVISQDDEGLSEYLYRSRPNILVISAGGYGHIPIPLIKGSIPLQPFRGFYNYSWDISFFGNHRCPGFNRCVMLNEIALSIQKFNIDIALGKTIRRSKIVFTKDSSTDWIQKVEKSKFNLAPRGFGRTSFRLAEIIQIGRIPVYFYDDVSWLPYYGTNISIDSFGFVGRMHQTFETLKQMMKMEQHNYEIKIEKINNIRNYYTYEGVIDQLDKFFQDPLGDSNYLRCQRVPEKAIYEWGK